MLTKILSLIETMRYTIKIVSFSQLRKIDYFCEIFYFAQLLLRKQKNIIISVTDVIFAQEPAILLNYSHLGLKTPPGMRGNRSRNENGPLRQKRSDTHIGTIEKQYGINLGVRSDMELGNYLERKGINSLNDLITE